MQPIPRRETLTCALNEWKKSEHHEQLYVFVSFLSLVSPSDAVFFIAGCKAIECGLVPHVSHRLARAATHGQAQDLPVLMPTLKRLDCCDMVTWSHIIVAVFIQKPTSKSMLVHFQVLLK